MSIRTYIFGLLTSLVLVISVLLSYQSARLFIGAFQMATEDIMYDIGQKYPNNGKSEQQLLDYHISTDWHNVPQKVRVQFSKIPKQTDTLHTKFVDWNYISPPNHIYSLMVTHRDGQTIFISRFNENIHQEIEMEHPDEFFLDPMLLIILIGIGVITIFVVMLLYIFRKIANPMESLQSWANQLTIERINKPRPNFRFKELNSLATLIHNNLSSMADSVEREQQFLSYASHELRTPIAVLRSNCALLEKVNDKPSDKERLIRDRIERASLTMKSMTETLLWLSRDGEIDVPLEPVNIGELIDQTTAELNYLLTGKTVEVVVTHQNTTLLLAKTPVTLVLNNLVRNAFQHTQQGRVEIIQVGNKISIVNHEKIIEQHAIQSELGFGLGTQLVENLIKRFDWHYETYQENNAYHVSVSFD